MRGAIKITHGIYSDPAIDDAAIVLPSKCVKKDKFPAFPSRRQFKDATTVRGARIRTECRSEQIALAVENETRHWVLSVRPSSEAVQNSLGPTAMAVAGQFKDGAETILAARSGRAVEVPGFV